MRGKAAAPFPGRAGGGALIADKVQLPGGYPVMFPSVAAGCRDVRGAWAAAAFAWPLRAGIQC